MRGVVSRHARGSFSFLKNITRYRVMSYGSTFSRGTQKNEWIFTRKVMRKIFRIFPCLSIYCGLAHHFNSNCMKLIEAVYGCVVLPVPHSFFSSFPYNSPFPSRTRIVSPVTDCVITKGYSRVLPDSETVTVMPVSARVIDHVGSSPDPEKFDPCV